MKNVLIGLIVMLACLGGCAKDQLYRDHKTRQMIDSATVGEKLLEVQNKGDLIEAASYCPELINIAENHVVSQVVCGQLYYQMSLKYKDQSYCSESGQYMERAIELYKNGDSLSREVASFNSSPPIQEDGIIYQAKFLLDKVHAGCPALK